MVAESFHSNMTSRCESTTDGMTEQTICRWKAKFSGMQVAEVKRLRELESEKARLNPAA
ncbi:hypothetical protein [Billgrantia diversa]|uniref:hypothetical protein n=1 Tax=Halomonas sp. MCCC 1A13316 TaxID=2733487 RepID=UPI002F961845